MAENKNVRPPMGGGPRGGRVVEKAKDFKGTTKKLLKNYLAKYKIPIIIVILFAVGSTIFSIIGPKILGNATTEIYNGIIRLWKNRANTSYIIRIICYKCIVLFNTRIYNDYNNTKNYI